MLNEKLIALVRRHNVLYDMSNPRYIDHKYKLTLWNEIGKSLNTPALECKSKWANIRDQLRRNLAKKSKSGKAAEKQIPYKYAKLLEFLLPHLSERDTMSNVPTPEEVAQIEVPQIENSATINEENNTSVVRVEFETANNNGGNEEPVTSRPQEMRAATKKRNKSVSENESTPATVLMEYILRKNDERDVPQHQMHTFLKSMGDILVNLSPRAQHTARGRIFSIVHELEYEALQETTREQHQPVSSWVPPPTHYYDGPSTSQGFSPAYIPHDYTQEEHQIRDYEADNPQ